MANNEIRNLTVVCDNEHSAWLEAYQPHQRVEIDTFYGFFDTEEQAAADLLKQHDEGKDVSESDLEYARKVLNQ